MSSYAIGYMGKWEWIENYLRVKRETIKSGMTGFIKEGRFLHSCAGFQGRRYFYCRAWTSAIQYPDHCHRNAGRKILTLCDLGLADRPGILKSNLN
jgi:hypothetical protein